MNHDTYQDSYLRGVLERTRTIALIGASAKPDRPSHGVMAFLLAHGYRVIPVNPGLAGTEVLGEACVAELRDIAEPVDMVDVFRTTDAVPAIVADAIAIGVKTLWLQLGIRHEAAAAAAEAAGLDVVMDRCPKIEIARLGL